jgi:hypothetical protein
MLAAIPNSKQGLPSPAFRSSFRGKPGTAGWGRGVVVEFRVAGAEAVRAEAVAEADIGMLQQVTLDALPIAGVVADFFAAGADGEQLAEGSLR